ncbi:MAG: sulfotransferase domain-containing protein [Coleofasciculus sp. E1-EBD-02]
MFISIFIGKVSRGQICIFITRCRYNFDNPENYSKGFGWYLGHFPSKLRKGNKLTFEDSPSYLYYEHIPQLIKQDLGNIKMIAILRNPVDRAYSAWQMYHSYSNLPLKHLRDRADTRAFTEAIDQEFNPESNTPNTTPGVCCAF